MSHKYIVVSIYIAMVALLGLSCSGGDALQSGLSAPTAPDLSPNRQQEAEPSNHYLWSFSNVLVDPGEMAFQLIPLRQAGVHWNVLKFLEQGPCLNCVKLAGFTPSGTGTVLVDVEIKHPFGNPRFTGFDVRGIVMFNGSHAFPASGLNASDRSLGEGELVNADGYTTLYNPDTFGSGPGGLQGYLKGKFASATYPDAHLNGYIRHISPGAANTRNAFYDGASILETYEIAMPSGPFIFGYAVDASWSAPSHEPVTDPMKDFPPEANCPEPWKIAAADSPVSQGLTDLGGSAELSVDVYDWQGKSSHLDPVIECPDLFDGTVTAGWQSDGLGFSTYKATLSNDKLAPAGEYRCLISVEDSENESAPEWLDLTAYWIHTLEVTPFQKSAPVPQATADPNPQTVCEAVEFSDDGSYDPDGGFIVSYEWDWDNDGAYDEAGNLITHTWNQVGSYEVGFRVTDDDSSTAETDLVVEIQNALPTAMAQADYDDAPVGQEVHFTSVGSQDNDCGNSSITLYEWDFSFDGDFNAQEQGSSVDHAFSSAGNYEVMLRVTDDEGGEGYLDAPLMVHVYEGLPPVIHIGYEPLDRDECSEIMFWDDGSYDPDGGLIVKYEWDWNNDLVFEEEGEGVSHSWNSVGTYYVQFRVTDDEGESTMLDSALKVTINDVIPTAGSEFSIYAAFIGENITFNESYSYDGACGGQSIVDCGWDWDNDLVVDEHGKTAVHSWDTKGQYTVQLQVTDDEGSSAWLLVPIQVDVFAGWARTWGASYIDVCTAVCTDDSGNVYAVGCFAGSVDFDPGIDEYILTAVGNGDAFLCKYDPGGNFLWAVNWGSSDFDNALAVAASGDGVYVTGMYFGTIDLDPDPDAADIWPCVGVADAYVSKFNSSGAYQWGKAFGGTGVDTGLGIVVGHSEAFVEVAGRFGDTVDFDPSGGVDNHASNGLCDCFLTRLTPSGEYVWTQTWGGTADDLATAVAVDANNNTYVTGSYRSTVDFDPSISVDNWTSAGDSDVFLTERDSTGVYVWTLAWGGTGSEYGASLTGGKLYAEVWVTGGFTGTADFDPTVGVDNRTSNGSNDVFVCGFNSAGVRYFADTWGGTGADYGYGITYRNDDILFVTGEFRDQADFDPGGGVQTRTSNGEVDAFLVALTWNGFFLWAETWGGAMYDRGFGVACLDESPQPTFVGGLFMGTVDFNPGPGVDLHTAPGTHENAFVSRFPEDGQW